MNSQIFDAQSYTYPTWGGGGLLTVLLVHGHTHTTDRLGVTGVLNSAPGALSRSCCPWGDLVPVPVRAIVSTYPYRRV